MQQTILTSTRLFTSTSTTFAAILLGLTATACGAAKNEAATEQGQVSPGPSATATAARATSTLERFTSDSNAFDTNSFWLDTGREVVVFDAQFTGDWARKLIAEIKSKTQSPIRFVVVTHPNPDKFNGASAFQAIGAKVVASKRTAAAIPGVHAYKKGFFVNVAKMFTEATYPAEAKIDVTFDGTYELPLENKDAKVVLRELRNRGVSSIQTVAHVPSLNAVIVGDLVHVKAHAWLEGGIVEGKATPDLASWKRALTELSQTFPKTTVYGGRGEAAAVDLATNEQIGYLDMLDSIVQDYVTKLGGKAKTELSGANAQGHYKAMTKLASDAFPSYKYSYMIEFGVYGLAQQRAAN
jgi:glyoxylase-like metal-dependent hydrolase (beta-lactamase superfamily II)